MEEELVMNSIQSIYNQKRKVLSSFQRNNRKVNTNYKPQLSNHLKEFHNLNDISMEITKSSKNNINEFEHEISFPIKDRYSHRYRLKTFNNNKTVNHSFLKNKNISKKNSSVKEKEIIKLITKKEELIKKNKIVYLLRKLYIILPNDIMDKYKELYPKLQFNFYYPTEIKSKRIIEYINPAQNEDIICNNLKDIVLEVYKYLKLSIKDFVKLEIYDENLHPIKLDSQLFVNKIRIIYIKIAYFSDEELTLWKQRMKSRMFFSNFNYNLNDASTEIKQEKYQNIEKNRNFKSIPKTIFIKNKNYNSNYFPQESDASTRYNTITQINEEKKLKNKMDLHDKRNQKINISSERKIINKQNVSESKNPESPRFNNIYLRSFNKNDEKYDDKKELEKNQLKIKKHFFANIIKKNGYKNNTLVSPLLFNFDVTDIINNKYVLKFLSNKNREKQEERPLKFKEKFKIKTLNVEDSNSKRGKKMSIIANIKSYLINKNINHNDKNSIMDKKKKILCELRTKINEFANNEIDNLISDEEIDDFRYLNCNYVLINEFKEFPVLKLKKKFIFFVYLSQKMAAKYENLFTNVISYNDFLYNILNSDEFLNSMNYLYNLYNQIIKKINFLVGYLSAMNTELKISFVFFILFIFYNKNLIEKNPMDKLIYISLECIDIPFNSEINFQQYCDYNLLMTRNNFLSYNKKFNFIKDLILRIFMNNRFNITKSLKILENIFEDININTIKDILNVDMCSVKSQNNIDIYNNITKIYEQFLNYIE